MMSLTFGLFTQVSGSGPLGPLVLFPLKITKNSIRNVILNIRSQLFSVSLPFNSLSTSARLFKTNNVVS